MLSSITWPSALTTIGSRAFEGCDFKDNDYTLQLPASVNTIGDYAFGYLHHLIIPSTSIVSIQGSSFIKGYTFLYVPANMVEIYKVRTNWSNYAGHIRSIDEYPVESSVGGEIGEAVDLGLSVKWASWNVGASAPEEYGEHFAWAETHTLWKLSYNWSSYKWCNGSSDSLTKYNTDSSRGTVDNKMQLDPEDDAASANWGDNWRIPTPEEWIELSNNCSLTWTSLKGINGLMITSNINGNSIFLPAAGEIIEGFLSSQEEYATYWSSSLDASRSDYAWDVALHSDSFNWCDRYARYYGRSVRPVYDAPGISINKTELTLAVGVSETLIAKVGPLSAPNKSVIWSSSDPSVASVEEDGMVTGVQAGTAVITATAVDGGYTAECTVTIIEVEPEAVDLGLSVKWASWNVGASAPEEYGQYFAWGESKPKDYYDWITYKWCNGNYNKLTKYCTSDHDGCWDGTGTPDGKTVLNPENDAAHVNWGGSWRMPTDAEWTELRENCTWTWTTQNGVNGRLVTSNINGNSIFLPAAGTRTDSSLYEVGSYGHFWSSSLDTDYPCFACDVYFSSDDVYRNSDSRCYGFSVRPVTE